MAALCRHMAPLVLSFPFPRTMSSYRLGFTCCTTASVTFGDISKFDRFIPTWTLRRWLFSEQGSESCTYCFSKGAPELCLQAVMHHRGPGRASHLHDMQRTNIEPHSISMTRS
ncbi:hypothetical protein CCUS01_02676 [Colletotrichum cuscutae]|uniref:Uncharacterized protein n=5 Tax=Colletotrichum acutatum species complex TaxID=2707335 RepID=A0AAI9YDN0_9PEZI|nr:hypothetical protein CCUS01_02676 [Colletotrichum cuscutae]